MLSLWTRDQREALHLAQVENWSLPPKEKPLALRSLKWETPGVVAKLPLSVRAVSTMTCSMTQEAIARVLARVCLDLGGYLVIVLGKNKV